jgi:two-component system response regulator YesN
MQVEGIVFFNLVIPLLAGLFFLLYFLYFMMANPRKTKATRNFVIFLSSFGLFLMGRAVQVAAGPHPLPLIIVNIRVFLLCAVVLPVAMRTASSYERKAPRKRDKAINVASIMLGVIYVAFNSLGTAESRVIYEGAGIVLRDNLTPSMLPPFYAREVTLAVQVVVGFLLLAFSVEKLLRLKAAKPARELARDKNFMINAGILAFAASFIAGSLLMQWWIYYAASVLSAIAMGASVIEDARESHAHFERLVPFVMEEIAQSFGRRDFSGARLREMLATLGKRQSMDTVIFARLERDAKTDAIAARDASMECVSSALAAALPEECHLALPVSREGFAILAALSWAPEGFNVLEALEKAHDEAQARTGASLKVGIGRSYPDLGDLRLSYLEALAAEEYAERLDDCAIMHASNMAAGRGDAPPFPLIEKERLVASVKAGDVAECQAALDAFLARFAPYAASSASSGSGTLKARLYELAGSLADAAILGGGDEKRLSALVVERFEEIAAIEGPDSVEAWLKAILTEIVATVGKSRERRARAIVEKAKEFVASNYMRQISYKDAAKAVFVSPSYFLALFKKEAGLTFTDYLCELRMAKAKELLRSSPLSVTEIAYEVGFNDPNYFSSTFKRVTGLSAMEWRKERDAAFASQGRGN